MFRDREDAGKQLAKKLLKYQGRDAIVIALPRGGVVVGHEIARVLQLPLDIVVTRKIGHPNDPEYAVCAVDETGTLLCNEVERAAIDEKWLKEETKRQQTEAQRRSVVYREKKKAASLKGSVVIITDDGIATGLTMRLAIATVKAQHPKEIVVAVPVAPPGIAQKIKREVNELIVLEPPEEFIGVVGAHYERLDQVEDTEVINLMA